MIGGGELKDSVIMTVGEWKDLYKNVPNSNSNKSFILSLDDNQKVVYDEQSKNWILLNEQSSTIPRSFGQRFNKNILRGSGLKSSKKKIQTPKGDRTIYIGKRGAKYIKLNGTFISLSKLKLSE